MAPFEFVLIVRYSGKGVRNSELLEESLSLTSIVHVQRGDGDVCEDDGCATSHHGMN